VHKPTNELLLNGQAIGFRFPKRALQEAVQKWAASFFSPEHIQSSHADVQSCRK
jgi:hypothetical protein